MLRIELFNLINRGKSSNEYIVDETVTAQSKTFLLILSSDVVSKNTIFEFAYCKTLFYEAVATMSSENV